LGHKGRRGLLAILGRVARPVCAAYRGQKAYKGLQEEREILVTEEKRVIPGTPDYRERKVIPAPKDIQESMEKKGQEAPEGIRVMKENKGQKVSKGVQVSVRVWPRMQPQKYRLYVL
jgi:hypothetical protein